jgi:hypothetical protein
MIIINYNFNSGYRLTRALALFNKITPINILLRVLSFSCRPINTNLVCFLANVLSIGRSTMAKILTLATGFVYFLYPLISHLRNQVLIAINSKGFCLFRCCFCYCVTCGELSAEPVSSADRIADWLNAVDTAHGVKVTDATNYAIRFMAA